MGWVGWVGCCWGLAAAAVSLFAGVGTRRREAEKASVDVARRRGGECVISLCAVPAF